MLTLDIWKKINEGTALSFSFFQLITQSFVQNLNKYTEILDKLKADFTNNLFRNFRKLENEFLLFTKPFVIDIKKVRLDLPMEIADLQTDTFLKIKCERLEIIEIYKCVHESKFTRLKLFTARIFFHVWIDIRLCNFFTNENCEIKNQVPDN